MQLNWISPFQDKMPINVSSKGAVVFAGIPFDMLNGAPFLKLFIMLY
jgi:hypothetical protein